MVVVVVVNLVNPTGTHVPIQFLGIRFESKLIYLIVYNYYKIHNNSTIVICVCIII